MKFFAFFFFNCLTTFLDFWIRDRPLKTGFGLVFPKAAAGCNSVMKLVEKAFFLTVAKTSLEGAYTLFFVAAHLNG